MNFGMLLFLYFLVLGPLLSVSSSSWLLCWSGLELGFFSLMPLLMSNNFSISKEVVLKYFSIQAFSSVLLFFSGMMIFSFFSDYMIYIFIFLLSLMLKLGGFPGHFWVPGVVSGLDWFSCCLILGPLKVAPFALLISFLSNFSNYQLIVLILGGLSVIFGAILGNNQTKIRAMIGASSISHTGWMMNACMFSQMWSYFLIYFTILVGFLLVMMKYDYLTSSLFLLSMSGLPPFAMFVAKMNIMFYLAQSNMWGFMFILIVGSIISLIFYLKFSYSLVLNIKNYKVWYLSSFMMMNFWGVLFLYLF
uniref:NADH-ubiquinone oxidoreductase chain 2 n=1 Tax=Pseudosuccinea columella TaxID=31228 RepID=A0A4P8Y3K8_PSECM|nr:NADH dehydrogenase subunit 2 [Pseudosuccinea columella]QCT09604.1 NADH dehydrogenase subunit 2 [Pseudosuccinea columella]